MSAIPYYLNYDMARLAVEAGVHFCDLGGNTEIVFKQKSSTYAGEAGHGRLTADSRGMMNILARHGIEQRSRGLGEDLRRRVAAASGAAQLYARLLARGGSTTTPRGCCGAAAQVKALSSVSR